MSQNPIHCLPFNTLLKQGQYQIQNILGQGGFGITYQGIHCRTSQPIAIKENWPENATRQGTTVIWSQTTNPQNRRLQLLKIATEARYLHLCKHPNIVQVYDWFEENDTAYVIMAFVPGKTLGQIFQQKGRLTQQQIIPYFIQVADALKIIHGANLLHRDIKPDNIIINTQNKAILIDFGATKEFIAGQTRKMSVTLTPGYAPYEQYSYRSRRFPATDIYGLCASMYELLTGQLPAEATERAKALMDGARDPLIAPRQLNPQIHPILEQILFRGLKMKVSERFQTADELIESLKQIMPVTKLVPRQSTSSIREFILNKNQFIIGRSVSGKPPLDLDLEPFSGSDTVSYQHSFLYQEVGEWKIKDLNSSNGTFIKPAGQHRFNKITTPAKLNPNDEISFGKVRFLFKII